MPIDPKKTTLVTEFSSDEALRKVQERSRSERSTPSEETDVPLGGALRRARKKKSASDK